MRKTISGSFLAVLLSCCILCSAGVAAFAEEEEPATTSTTTVTEAVSETTTEAASEKESSTEAASSEKSKADESTTESKSEKDAEASTSETTTAKDETTEPTTKKEENPDFAANYTGIAETTYDGVKGWWRVVNGKVQPNATGVYRNEYGWWYVKNGRVDFSFNGVEKNEYGWWRIEKGKVNFRANGIYQNRYGWWKTTNGKVTFKETGVFKNEYGWWRVEKSKVNFKATGIYQNEYGSWYVKNGKVDFKKTGTVTIGKTSYTVTDGKVRGTTIKVPLINQLPNYPTGCEAASATMVLKAKGYDINLDKMINTIPRENLRTVDGKRYGPRITEKFVGDPRGTYTSKTPGYGAFAPVVTKAINSVLKNQHGSHKAYDRTGATFTEVLKCIDRGNPVIVWATYNLQTPSTVNAWYIATNQGPEYFSYPRGTHVMVLVGYDAKNVYVADPYGAKTKTFTRSAFNDKYKLLGRQAVVVE